MKRRTVLGGALILPLAAACGGEPVGTASTPGSVVTSGGATAIPAGGEVLADPRVRQAMAYAIDMKSVTESLFQGAAKPANTLMPDGPFKPTNGLEAYAYDPEKAKQLLAEAGWDSSRELDLVYYYGDQATVDFMAAVQQYLDMVGMKVKPRKLEGDLASQLWVKPDDPVAGPSGVKWDLAYAAIAALAPQEYYNRFLPTYSGNSYWPDNPEYTALIEETSASADPEVQAKAFHETVNWESKNLPGIPLYYQPVFIAYSDKLDRKGAAFGNDQYNYDWAIHTWDIPAGSDGKKTLRTNGGPVEFFDMPFFNPGVMLSQKIMWDHLIVADENLVPKAGQLAENYEISDDGLTITFTMRDGITWHDGEPITAEDVKFTFEFAKKVPTVHTVFAGTLEKISDIAVSGKQVVFTFSELDSMALTTFSQLPPLPQKHLASSDPLTFQQDPYFQNPIGSGPFKAVDIKMGDYALYEAFEGYWQGRPVIDQVRQYPSGESDPNLVKNVQAGTVDYAYSKSIDDVLAIAQVPGMKTESVDVFYTRLFFVNSFPKP